jgi:hypothetical protein
MSADSVGRISTATIAMKSFGAVEPIVIVVEPPGDGLSPAPTLSDADNPLVLSDQRIVPLVTDQVAPTACPLQAAAATMPPAAVVIDGDAIDPTDTPALSIATGVPKPLAPVYDRDPRLCDSARENVTVTVFEPVGRPPTFPQ